MKTQLFQGPSVTEFTKEETAKAAMNFAGTDCCWEVSHRSEFQVVVDETIAPC